MPSFNPRGFQYSRSLTASQPFANGLQTFIWDERFNGFAGDACVNMLYDGGSTAAPGYAPTPQTTLGKVFPLPLSSAPVGYTPPSGVTIAYPNVSFPVGVISSFKYYPASLSSGNFIVSSTYPRDTARQANTYVEVQVVVDPKAVYSIQMKTDTGITVANGSLLYSAITADAANTYTVTVPYTGSPPADNVFLFPMGVFEGNGAFAGSRCYLDSRAINSGDLIGNGGGNSSSSALILGLTNGIEGNGFSATSPSDPNTPIAPIVANPTLDVILANNFFESNFFTSFIAVN